MDITNFRVVRHVTLPLLKMEEGRPYYVKIIGQIFQAEQVKNPKKTKIKQADGSEIEVVQAPPFIVHVDDLEGGHPAQMIANEVLKSELEKQYPNNSYVGKFFELTKNTKVEGRKYNTFGITELAKDEPVEDEVKQKGGSKGK